MVDDTPDDEQTVQIGGVQPKAFIQSVGLKVKTDNAQQKKDTLVPVTI